MKRHFTLLFLLYAYLAGAQSTFTVTNNNDSGAGTLRQAILDAEANPGADIVDLTGISATIQLASGLPELTEDLTINGGGSGVTIIDGASLYRAFFIQSGNVSIKDVTIQNCKAEGQSSYYGGAGAGMGGAIFVVDASLDLTNVILDNNSALGGSAGASGVDGQATGVTGGAGPLGADGSPLFGEGGKAGSSTASYYVAKAGSGVAGGFGAGGGGGGSHALYGVYGGYYPGSGGAAGTFGGAGGGGSRNSTGTGGGGAGLGGAVFVDAGSLNITDVTFSNNSTSGGTGYQSGKGKGGALFVNNGVTASGLRVTFTDNTASDADALDTDNNNLYGTVSITTSIVISSDPSDQTLEQGQDATFTVVATGSGAAYQWQQFDGTNWVDLSDGDNISGATTDAVSISCIDTDIDQAKYRCVVTGTLNTETSAEAVLTVTPYAAMTISLSGTSELYCDAGGTYTYTASSSNTVGAALYTWYKNGTVISGESGATASIAVVPTDEIKVEVTDPSACFNRTEVSSDPITISVLSGPITFDVTSVSSDENVANSFPWAVNQVNNIACDRTDVSIDFSQLSSGTEITLSSRVSFYNSVKILGNNVKLISTLTSGSFIELSGASNFEIENLNLSHPAASNPGPAINVYDATTRLKNVYIQGFEGYSAIKVRSMDVTIEDVTSSDSRHELEFSTSGLGATVGSPASISVLNSDLRNSQYAAIYVDESEPVSLTVKNTIMKGYKEAIELRDVDAVYNFTNCSFINAYEDAVKLANQAIPTFTNCTFSGNGLGATNDSQAGHFGAILQEASAGLNLYNCTFVNNQTAILHGYNYSSFDFKIYNSIFLDNTDGNLIQYAVGSGDVQPTVTEGSNLGYPSTYTGTASEVLNITLTAPGPYSLEVHELISCSPASNQADATYATDTDALGKSRLGLPDQGAVEGYGFLDSSPADVNQFVGESVSFYVSATSSVTLSYQWQVDEGTGFTDIVDGATYTGATSSSLTVSAVEDAMSDYSYRVNITDGECAITSGEALLNVQHLPTSADASITMNEDEIYTFSSGDITFNDADGDAFSALYITTDVANGTLLNDGNPIVIPSSGKKSIYTNEVKDMSLLTYEPPANANGDNYDSFTFYVTDDSGFSMKGSTGNTYTMTINVSPVNDAPTDIVLTAVSLDENNAVDAEVATLSTTDVDASDVFTYSLVTGTGSDDNAAFSISGDKLLAAQSFNFESQSSFNIRVATDDGTATFEKAFTITVNDVNDAPTLALSANSIDENEAVGTAIATISTTDEDAGASAATLSLVSGATDNDQFSISGTELQTAASFDYEAKSSYDVTIRADDGNGGITDKVFTISVNDINEAPTDITVDATNVDENVPVGTLIGNISTADPDAGDTHSYEVITTLSYNGADYAPVTVSDGRVYTAIPIDFETLPALAVEFKSTDAGGLSVNTSINFTVNDLNEAPTKVEVSASTIAENESVGTAIGTLSAMDPDAGDTHTFTLASGVEDNDDFTITDTELSSNMIFDYETKNSYTIVVTATDAKGLTYDETLTITVSDVFEKLDQAISFDALSNKTYGDADFDLAATSDSGLDITYTSSDNTIVSISGVTASIKGAGTVTITASQAGNDTYNAATDVQVSLTIDKADQTITFGTLAEKSVGDADFDLAATTDSGLDITYTSSDETIASISGNTVSILTTGEVTITASQSGNANYNAAADATQKLVIKQSGQTITFDALPEKTFGDADFDLAASSDSGLDITYASSDDAVASISGKTVTIHGAGTVTITASQSGNADYAAATDVTQTLTINKAVQTLTFDALEDKTFGDADFVLIAASDRGLDVTFSSSDDAIASIDGKTVTIHGAGAVTITASQSGNTNYSAATDVTQTLTINKADQTLTFDALEDKTFGDADFDLAASSDSGLGITFSSSDDAIASVSGKTVTIHGAGTVTITASQSGNAEYAAATDVTQTLTIKKADQVITFADISDISQNEGSVTLDASASSGLEIVFQVSGPVTLSGNTLTATGTGSVTVTATQPGNNNYLEASPVSKSFEITAGEAFVLGISKTELQVYPNPFVDSFTLNISDQYKGEVAMQVLSQDGRIITSKVYQKSGDQLQVQHSLNVPSGIYMMVLQWGDKQMVKRLIKR